MFKELKQKIRAFLVSYAEDLAVDTEAQFDFGDALMLLENGLKVQRKGWNGKGMYLYLVSGTIVDRSLLRNEAKLHAPDEETISINSHIDMKSADGSIVVGWLASQTDMLAKDWIVVK